MMTLLLGETSISPSSVTKGRSKSDAWAEIVMPMLIAEVSASSRQATTVKPLNAEGRLRAIVTTAAMATTHMAADATVSFVKSSQLTGWPSAAGSPVLKKSA